jgi:hypothetical protein
VIWYQSWSHFICKVLKEKWNKKKNQTKSSFSSILKEYQKVKAHYGGLHNFVTTWLLAMEQK